MTAFQKNGGALTASISATTTSGRAAMSGVSGGGDQVRVAVDAGATSAAWAYIAFGDDTVEATVNDIAMRVSTVEVFTVGRGVTHFAVRTDVGTAVVKAIRGTIA